VVAFVDRYDTKVYAWSQRWGLQEADAHDVTQNVMLELARQIRGSGRTMAEAIG
jgi:RNA polymerase sigma-70 factor (ECF subfamily)